MHEPAGGGSLYALYELVKNLDQEIFSPFVLCYYKNKYTEKFETIPGCTVFYLYKNGFVRKESSKLQITRNSRLHNYFSREISALKEYFIEDKKEVQEIASVIRKIIPDIVHHNNGLRVNRSSIRAVEKMNIPQLVQTRGNWHYQKNSFQFLADKYLSHKISKWIFYTEEAREYQKRMLHIPMEKMHVFNDIVNDDKFHEMPANIALQAEMKIQQSDFVITSPGRIIEWKGQHVLLEAINTIKEKIKPFTLLIVGPFDDGIGSVEYYNLLKQLVIKYKLEKQVIFTGNRDDMPAIFNLSNLVVHSSIKPEPQGLVIIEALFCKKNVIATNAGGPTGLFEKYGGVLVQPGDADALAKAILHFYNNRSHLHTSENENFYEKLKFDFDKRKQIAAMMGVYRDMLPIQKKQLIHAAMIA